ncbi:phosphate acyltransferase PlsX [Massiliimalia timonensis]|uniref:phosphate acyltransferase PlsX n=1 Tax=Massiliimalia timonensis TaxID=1987501 RepID=UPI0018A038FA|nr:phosphate acyltransferase PlsX [Massiliimalia timonensis]
MKVVVDGFGGDNAPLSVLQGSALAVKEYGVSIIMTGDESVLRKTAQEHNISVEGITFHHTEDVIEVCDDPTSIVKEHAQSSMAVAMKLLADGEADAFVSAGSTGAVVVGASLIVKRLKGIKRASIATVIPSQQGCFLLADAGANLECRPEMLTQFAMMGSIYMNRIIGVENPRIGLVNVGEEETKGRELQLETFSMLKESGMNFVGNVEARDIPLGKADVVVADGFTGNVILKLTEGLAKFLMGNIKDIFMGSLGGKMAAALILKDMKKFKQKMDYKEYGGAPLLGSAKPVIKAHGSSDGYAYKNAIRQACDFVKQDVNGEIAKVLREQKAKA